MPVYFHHYLNLYFLLEIVYFMFISYLSIDRLLDRYLCHLGWNKLEWHTVLWKKNHEFKVQQESHVLKFMAFLVPWYYCLTLGLACLTQSLLGVCSRRASAVTSRRSQSQYWRAMVVFTVNQSESGRPVTDLLPDLLPNRYAHLHCSFKPSCLGLF